MKNIVKKAFILLFIFSNFVYSVIDKNKFVQNPKLIIFEIEDTLIQLDYFKALYNYFGFYDMAKNSLSSENLNQFYINTLYKININNKRSFYSNAIPQIQKEFLLGKLTSGECLNIIQKWINNNRNYFDNDSKRKVFAKIANFNFDPKIYFTYQKETKVIDLMRKAYEKTDENFKRINIIFVVSNQSKESINILKSNFSKIFQYSDEQFFSSQYNCLKNNGELITKAISMVQLPISYLITYVDNNNEIKPKLNNHKINVVTSKNLQKALLEINAL